MNTMKNQDCRIVRLEGDHFSSQPNPGKKRTKMKQLLTLDRKGNIYILLFLAIIALLVTLAINS